MPRPRSETTLDDRGRARRTREARKAYIAALENAVCHVYRLIHDNKAIGWHVWRTNHATTIARARGATTTTTTED